MNRPFCSWSSSEEVVDFGYHLISKIKKQTKRKKKRKTNRTDTKRPSYLIQTYFFDIIEKSTCCLPMGKVYKEVMIVLNGKRLNS